MEMCGRSLRIFPKHRVVDAKPLFGEFSHKKLSDLKIIHLEIKDKGETV